MLELGATVVAVALLAAALGPGAAEGDAPTAGVIVRQLRQPREDGPAPGEVRVVTWTAAGRVRLDVGTSRSVIVDPGGLRGLVLDHAARTWREVPLAGGTEPAEAGGLGGGGLTVTATDETRVVGGFTCRKYLVRRLAPLGNASPPLARDSEVWASAEAGPAPPPRALAALLGLPLLPGASLGRELANMAGLPVLQEERASLPGRLEETATRLTGVEERAVASAIWQPPAGYTRAGP